jgi:CheY-like chemotaxis protein
MNNSNNRSNNSNSNNNNKNRILVVDDEPDITLIFAMGLEDNGFTVDAFNDPIQALSSFKSDLYDLALLDYKMPNMNGFELYREIRKIDHNVKVCFVTAFELYYEELKNKFQTSSSITSSEHKREDVKCFIPKPVDIDDLVVRIKEELNS